VKTISMYAWFWLKNVLLSLDQLLNAILWGDPDETLSRRAGRARETKRMWGCWLCGLLDRVDPRHCEKTLARLTREEGHNSVPRMISRWRSRHGRAVTAISYRDLGVAAASGATLACLVLALVTAAQVL
jgi:hypothetical protein